MRIVADDKIPFLKGVLEDFAEVIYLPGKDIDNKVLKNADALLVRTRTKCTETLLHGTSVKFIATATIGFDHIDTAYCNTHKIKWTNAPGCNSSSVKQYITAALLRLEHDHKFTLKDKTLGIIGVGNVGSRVENSARILGMNVLLNDPPRARKDGESGFVDLDTILSESDIVTIHVPLNIVGEDQTFHLFDDSNFKKIKKGTWFINSSRGEVAETVSLKKALNSGKLAGAILDVWENEPDIDPELLSASFIATPHIAGYSTDGKANGTAMAVSALHQYFNLPLVNWYPDNIPDAEFPLITINCSGKTTDEILRSAVFHTYNIKHDDNNLRSSPTDFEKQRGEYRVRREFPAFSIKLQGGNEEAMKILGDMGFRIL